MRLRQLETFIAACELGSINRAAEKLYVAQPALGLQIRGLEDEFGAQLLERDRRGVRPTEAGKVVLAWAREMVQSRRAVHEKLESMAAGFTGRVTLGMTPSIAAAFAVTILSAVEERHGGVHLQLLESASSQLLAQVSEGRVDLALTLDASTEADPARDILVERLHFISAADKAGASTGARRRKNVAAGLPEANAPITMSEVLEHPLVLPSPGNTLRQCVDDAARSLGVTLSPAYEVQSTSVVLTLVREGLASSIMPLAIAAEHLSQGTLVARPITSPTLTRRLRWITSERGATDPLHDALRRLITSTIQVAAQDPRYAGAYAPPA